MDVREFARFFNLRIGRRSFAEPDVFADRIFEKERKLRELRDLLSQGGERHVRDLFASDRDPPALRIKKAQEQIHQG